MYTTGERWWCVTAAGAGVVVTDGRGLNHAVEAGDQYVFFSEDGVFEVSGPAHVTELPHGAER